MRRRSTISASIQGLHPARRRERQREKRRASAVLAGGSWSGYVVTNPPREQPLNEDDCVYVFMSLRQLRDASAPNGRRVICASAETASISAVTSASAAGCFSE